MGLEDHPYCMGREASSCPLLVNWPWMGGEGGRCQVSGYGSAVRLLPQKEWIHSFAPDKHCCGMFCFVLLCLIFILKQYHERGLLISINSNKELIDYSPQQRKNVQFSKVCKKRVSEGQGPLLKSTHSPIAKELAFSASSSLLLDCLGMIR